MKKTLIALAVLGSVAGVAQAQSNVTVYGKLDVSVTKSTGTPTQLDHNHNSRLGFKGSEDLGGGLSAIFQIENRFFADTGMQKGAQLFQGQSNVGLKGNFGTVRLGRIYNPVDDIAAGLDPFGQDGVGSMMLNALVVTRQDNSIRYDSPNFNGFGVQAIYSFKEPLVTPAPANSRDGFGVSATYDNGPISLAAGWNRNTNTTGVYPVKFGFAPTTTVNLTDTNYWVVGGGYTVGALKATALYEKAKADVAGVNGTQKNALIGLAYNVGAGTINATAGRLKSELTGSSVVEKKYAIGYTHNLSKRTSLYGDASRKTNDITGSESINAYEVGVTHNF